MARITSQAIYNAVNVDQQLPDARAITDLLEICRLNLIVKDSTMFTRMLVDCTLTELGAAYRSNKVDLNNKINCYALERDANHTQLTNTLYTMMRYNASRSTLQFAANLYTVLYTMLRYEFSYPSTSSMRTSYLNGISQSTVPHKEAKKLSAEMSDYILDKLLKAKLEYSKLVEEESIKVSRHEKDLVENAI